VFGNRIERIASGTETAHDQYAYDVASGAASGVPNAWADLDSSSSLTTRRIYSDGVNEPLARIVATASWYLADRMGSVRDITDDSGDVIDHIAYDAFGVVTNETQPTNGDRIKFQGMWFDSLTGHLHAVHRELDPVTHQWLQEDPLGLGPDANPRRAMGNNPTNATDASGLKIIFADKDSGSALKAFAVVNQILNTGYQGARAKNPNLQPLPHERWIQEYLENDKFVYYQVKYEHEKTGQKLWPVETLKEIAAYWRSSGDKDGEAYAQLVEAMYPGNEMVVTSQGNNRIKLDRLTVTYERVTLIESLPERFKNGQEQIKSGALAGRIVKGVEQIDAATVPFVNWVRKVDEATLNVLPAGSCQWREVVYGASNRALLIMYGA